MTLTTLSHHLLSLPPEKQRPWWRPPLSHHLLRREKKTHLTYFRWITAGASSGSLFSRNGIRWLVLKPSQTPGTTWHGTGSVTTNNAGPHPFLQEDLCVFSPDLKCFYPRCHIYPASKPPLPSESPTFKQAGDDKAGITHSFEGGR